MVRWFLSCVPNTNLGMMLSSDDRYIIISEQNALLYVLSRFNTRGSRCLNALSGHKKKERSCQLGVIVEEQLDNSDSLAKERIQALRLCVYRTAR